MSLWTSILKTRPGVRLNPGSATAHSNYICTTSTQKAPHKRKQHNRKEKQQATHHNTGFSTWNIFLVKWKILQVTYVQWIDKLLALLNCRKRLMSTCQYSCWMPIDQAYYFAAFELCSNKLRFSLDIKYFLIVLYHPKARYCRHKKSR